MDISKKQENIQILIDALTVLLCWGGAYFIRFKLIPNAQSELEILFFKLAPLLLGLTLYKFYSNRLYQYPQQLSLYREIISLIQNNVFAIIYFVIALYFFGNERVSRLTIGIYALLSTPALVIGRIVTKNAITKFRQKGRYIQKTMLIGNGKPLFDYVNKIRLLKNSGIHFVGWIDANNPSKDNIPKFDNYQRAKEKTKPDMILLSYCEEDFQKNKAFLDRYYNDVIPIKFLPDIPHSLIGHQFEDFNGIPILNINATRIKGIDFFIKRCLDFIGSFLGLLILMPFFILIACLIKLFSKGPALYSQERVGFEGKSFTMWKFRTMEVAKDNKNQTEWSNPNNPRKTFFGNFLRKTSLDEFPQLWNVLKGEMGLIGPRPEQPFFVEKFKQEIPGYMLRHKIRPGMTGWAQINGWRGNTSLKKRIEYDIYYIKNWSLWFDIKILLLTLLKGLINKNAY